MWGLMKQQVFLGMAASSVPVKPGVPNMVEDLMASGVRFVYYSPRNMRRSKVRVKRASAIVVVDMRLPLLTSWNY